MSVLVFFILNFIVLITGYLISTYFDNDSLVDQFISIFTVYITEIITITLLLGILNLLELQYIFLTILIIFLIVFSFTNKENINTDKLKIPDIFHDKFNLFLILISLLIILVIFYIGLLFSPSFIDSLMYHLVLPVEWLKAGKIFVPNTSWVGNQQVTLFYPANAELYMFWNILPFHSDFIVDLSQLPFLIFGSLACFSISRKLGFDRNSSLVPSFLFFFTPVFLIQSRSAYNDLIFSTLFLLTVNFILKFKNTNEMKILVMASITSGLMLGTKYTGLFYFLPVLLFFIIINKNYSFKKISKYVTIFILISLLFGGYWYGRNLYQEGSMLANFPVSEDLPDFIAGKTYREDYFEDYESNFVKSTEKWALYPFKDGMSDKSGYTVTTGFGPQLITLIIPSFLLFLIFSFKNKEFEHSAIGFIIILIFLIVFISGWRNPRFLLPIYGLSCVSTAFVYSRLKNKNIFKIILTFCVIFSFMGVIFNLAPYEVYFLKYNDKGFPTHLKYNSTPMTHLTNSWYWLNKNTQDSNIAYTNLNIPYYLYGKGFKNNVNYINPNNYSKWKKKILRNDYLYINLMDVDDLALEGDKRPNTSIPIEYAFTQDQKLFDQVYDSKYVKIFSIHKESNKSSLKVIDVGGNDEKYLGKNWYQKEVEDIRKNTFRWGGKGNCSSINVELAENKNYSLFVKVASLVFANRSKEQQIKVLVNGRKVGDFVITPKNWDVYEVDMNKKMIKENNKIKFCYKFIRSPYNITKGSSNDKRKLGAMFDYIVFAPKNQ